MNEKQRNIHITVFTHSQGSLSLTPPSKKRARIYAPSFNAKKIADLREELDELKAEVFKIKADIAATKTQAVSFGQLCT